MRNRKLRMEMIGGGINAFIGSTYRCAVLTDNEIESVCRYFSRKEETLCQSGRILYLPGNRIGNDCEMDGKWQPWND